jgi:hypothetical protein
MGVDGSDPRLGSKVVEKLKLGVIVGNDVVVVVVGLPVPLVKATAAVLPFPSFKKLLKAHPNSTAPMTSNMYIRLEEEDCGDDEAESEERAPGGREDFSPTDMDCGLFWSAGSARRPSRMKRIGGDACASTMFLDTL